MSFVVNFKVKSVVTFNVRLQKVSCTRPALILADSHDVLQGTVLSHKVLVGMMDALDAEFCRHLIL